MVLRKLTSFWLIFTVLGFFCKGVDASFRWHDGCGPLLGQAEQNGAFFFVCGGGPGFDFGQGAAAGGAFRAGWVQGAVGGAGGGDGHAAAYGKAGLGGGTRVSLRRGMPAFAHEGGVQ